MTAIQSLKELYRHRVLAYVLIARELKVRYRGTFFGFLWSLLNPLVLALTYMLVFSVIMRTEMPLFYVFLLAGILPWTCFASTLAESSLSILMNGGLIKKVALPSEIFPLVSAGTSTVHCLLGSFVLIVIMIVSGAPLSWYLLAFPFVLAVQMLFTFGLALFLAALTVQFRDLQHMTPNLLTVWFFLTPIVYPLSSIPQPFATLAAFNPMTQLIVAYQNIFYHGRPPYLPGLLSVTLFSVVLLVLGLSFFDARREFMAEEV